MTDSTAIFNELLEAIAGTDFILYVDAGVYIFSDTITIPANTIVVGECWSQLMASGGSFTDTSNPTPLVQIGNEGDEGTMQLQDLLFTTQGGTAGLIVWEWNLNSATQGGAAMWGKIAILT